MKRIINPTIVHSATQPTEKADLWIKALPNNQNTLMIFDNGYENVDSNLTERLNNEAQAREDADVAEANKRLEEDTKLNNRVDKEITDRTNADNALNTTLTNKINEEITARTNADNALSNRITTNLNSINTINSKIPSQASPTNQLADKEFVNSSIANDAATFQGTFESVNDLPTTNVKKNDYAFIVTVVSGGNPEYKRYKYNGTQWLEEFVLNNSSFTANQWAAINSGISSNWMNDTIQSINEEVQARQDADNLIWEKLNKVTSQVQEITWAELKALRDNSNLTSGQFYRITDYQCTTVQSNTRSAGNQFDIIVLALTNNTLSEQAWAALHSGDTYFANSNLSAWKLWYCLDNDTTRFAWADNTSGNGRGVIYRMIDEFNNDVPYDFKNIQCTDWSGTLSGYFYTFNLTTSSSKDSSLSSDNLVQNNFLGLKRGWKISKIGCTIFIGKNIYDNEFNNSINNIFTKGTVTSNIFRTIVNNKVTNSFNDNTSCEAFNNNIITGSFTNNNINNVFQNNNINNRFNNNNIDGEFRVNIVNYAFSQNTIVTACTNSNLGDLNCYYNVFYNCDYIKLQYSGVGGSTNGIQNYIFTSGLSGKETSPLTINLDSNRKYETKVGLNSSGELKQWCEADLVQ